MVEMIVGPVVALLVAMKFTKYTDDQRRKSFANDINALRAELIQKNEAQNAELAKKMLITVSPMAKALREVKETIGV